MRSMKINALVQPLFAIFIGLLVGAIAMRALGEPVIETYSELWKGAFGNLYFVMSTLARATPILLIALGVSIAFRAGAFNLGGEGQMVLAAVSAALVALYLPGPGFVKLMGAVIVGFAVAGGWSALAGWMEAKFKVQLIISTLLMNYIAVLFASYLVSHPFQDRDGSAALAQTKLIDASAWIPKILTGMSVHYGFIIAIVIAIGLFVTFRYSAIGYEVNMLGKNPFFTSYGGVHRTKVMLISMFVSGGIAGLAGVFEVLGSHHRFVDNALTVPEYAWIGIMAALLAKSNPIAIVFSSIFLAALHTGSLGVERNTDVPLEIASVIQAVLILFISAQLTLTWIKALKKERKNNGTI
ncbi:ABC transporter permease [Halalkalibacter hemicellulosilyticus]|uniref:ABC transporter permease n=1 Tax=Halalkalibacter hemicellulosilyticusJCM 9152 TaxID=1236971 RepID=W4QKT2_9BACI|nr:ABC transporter permease [Halalkalibacter hemicellulosilyticus]GAE32258.1 ABC transporter permease [Halalkalibacter hemicellulosilyticusJCM 9152]